MTNKQETVYCFALLTIVILLTGACLVKEELDKFFAGLKNYIDDIVHSSRGYSPTIW